MNSLQDNCADGNILPVYEGHNPSMQTGKVVIHLMIRGVITDKVTRKATT